MTLRRLRVVLFSGLVCALTSCGGSAREDVDDDVGSVASGGEAAPSLESLAESAVSEDRELAARSIAALRAAGPRGHAALMNAHWDAIVALRDDPPLTPDAATERLRHAVDVVSGQRDGHASGLYWHTDLAEAQAEARATNRPILSLRLLGRLDEEMSCANSRYFRLVLYPNRAVSNHLRENYVLHWSSERPVPRVTIDMGDGRRIERTLTGNSIHYVLDADGRVIDALPGLYTPRTMLTFLVVAQRAHQGVLGVPSESLGVGEGAVTASHTAELERTTRALELARRSFPAVPARTLSVGTLGAPPTIVAVPSAIEAMPLTVSKLAVEGVMIDAMRAPGTEPVDRGDVDWTRVGREAYGIDAGSVFDATSAALFRLKTGRDDDASAEVLLALSRTVVGDAARNEATFRIRILEWLTTRAAGEPRPTLEAFNERVYSELFLTPASDPWLGLTDPTVWDAIERIH